MTVVASSAGWQCSSDIVLINLVPGGGHFTLISDLNNYEESKVLNAISDVTYRNDDIIALCHCVP